MSIGHSPSRPETPRPWTLLEAIAAVIVIAVIVIGAVFMPQP